MASETPKRDIHVRIEIDVPGDALDAVRDILREAKGLEGLIEKGRAVMDIVSFFRKGKNRDEQ